MPHLDPTYLRYIYDGLIKGSVHPDNASELPDGLIGLYEEAFEEHLPIIQRQKLLKRFALFALLKKEVSVHFVCQVLEESETEILEFINTFSSWFNSPEPWKFQLYHERLKVYVLQKFSEKEIQKIHEKLISHLEKAIEEQQADEFERYALEFLSEHLTVEAFWDETKGKKLLDYTKNETTWDRQIRISNKFDWSRKGLHQAALWTSKHDQEENIDCYLDLVQLHNKEQNDAENIVRLVANNEIDLALERITAFGGPSKEEKERQFILFMLCLMELTLLESKTKPWRKEAIEKLLKHLENEIPVDHSLVNWGEFFPSYLMFKIVSDWTTLGLDNLVVFNLNNEWEIDWLEKCILFSDIQLNLLLRTTDNINRYEIKYNAICKISSELLKRGKIQEASELLKTIMSLVSNISNANDKNKTLRVIALELTKQGKLDESINLAHSINNDFTKSQLLGEIAIELAKYKKIEEALEIIKSIKYINDKIQSNIAIAAILTKQGENEKSLNLIKNCLEIILRSKFDNNKINALIAISNEFAKHGKDNEFIMVLTEAHEMTRNIEDRPKKIEKLLAISTELANFGRIELSKELIQESFELANGIEELSEKDYSISLISAELAKQGKLQDAIQLTQYIDTLAYKSNALKEIAIKLTKQGKLKESLEKVQEIVDGRKKNSALKEIISELTYQGKTKKSYETARNSANHVVKQHALMSILMRFTLLGNIIECSKVLFESLKTDKDNLNDRYKSNVFVSIALENLKKGYIQKANVIIQRIPNYIVKINAYRLIAKELVKQELMQESNDLSLTINDNRLYNEFLVSIALELVNIDRLNESIDVANSIGDKFYRGKALEPIVSTLAKQGNFQKSIELCYEIDDVCWYKNIATSAISIELVKAGNYYESLKLARNLFPDNIEALINIASELSRQGKIDESQKVLNEALNNSNIIYQEKVKNKTKGINPKWEREQTIAKISLEFTRQGKFQKSLELLRIIDEHPSSETIVPIVTELVKQGRINESIDFIDDLKEDIVKSKALIAISSQLFKEGKVDYAENILNKSLKSIKDIRFNYHKCIILNSIATELLEQQKKEECLNVLLESFGVAKGIISTWDKNESLSKIALIFTMLNNYKLAQNVSLEINQNKSFIHCWKDIVVKEIKNNGFDIALEKYSSLTFDKVKSAYLECLVEEIEFVEIDEFIKLKLLFLSMGNIKTIEKLVRKHSLNLFFFKNPNQDKIFKMYNTLNLQWSLDLKKELDQIPN